MNINTLIYHFLKLVKENFPQIISVFGTLSGAILGWFLKYLQENIGKTCFSIDSFENYIDKNELYAYNLKLFICNKSLKPKYIRNLKLIFYKDKNLVYEQLTKNNATKDYIKIHNKKDVGVLCLKYNEPCVIDLCNLISIENINGVNRIIFSCETENGKIIKLKIKKNFSITNVEQYPEGELFPN